MWGSDHFTEHQKVRPEFVHTQGQRKVRWELSEFTGKLEPANEFRLAFIVRLLPAAGLSTGFVVSVLIISILAEHVKQLDKQLGTVGSDVLGSMISVFGIVIMSISLLMFLVYFPDKGGMLVKAGGLGSYDPQIIKPPAEMRGADQMNYDDVKPTTKAAA